MRTGVFGGTFDPVHIGHLIVADRVRQEWALDRVLFVPSAIPPHKVDDEISPGQHRLEMLRIALSGNKAFEMSDIEI